MALEYVTVFAFTLDWPISTILNSFKLRILLTLGAKIFTPAYVVILFAVIEPVTLFKLILLRIAWRA